MKVEKRTSRRTSRRGARAGAFTLLELIVAFTIMALFILPILQIVHESRVRAIKYTRERQVRDLGQRKLFERIYYIEPQETGTFELEGHPDWIWEVPYPEVVSKGNQILLQYTIQVSTPEGQQTGGRDLDLGEARPAFEMSVWTFPSQEWYEEQSLLESQGYGAAGGMLPGGFNGF